jgi:AraC-like DNA-binding protein
MDKTSYFMYFFKNVMKQKDTTNPQAHRHSRSLLSNPQTERAFIQATGFRIHILGLYHTRFDLEWSSSGKRECDYLHHIDLSLSGEREVIHGSRSVSVLPGNAYFFPGNTPVERRCSKPGTVLYLSFRCEWLPGVDPLMDWEERTPTKIGKFNAQDWKPLITGNDCNDVNLLLKLQAQVYHWMAEILPPMGTLISNHLASHARFINVFDAIEAKLGADLRISELAKLQGSSIHAFSMLFSEHTGVTPKEYLNRRLNQEAIQLVIGTDLKIKEIAERLRFTDEFYFSRFFQKLNGVPPSKYRNRFYA